jgi:tRNA (guanosine-2'-O-)-methyltransferase
MDDVTRDKLINYLGSFVTPARAAKVQQVLEKRTRHIAVVMEDFENSLNVSAVLRSCEAMGVQDVHIIENQFRNKLSAYVAKGGSKWLTVTKHNEHESKNSSRCLQLLKDAGYQIWVTSPDQSAADLNDVDVDSKIALVFGTEFDGASKEVLEMADQRVCLPMQGFTESYNVSVSVALCLHILLRKLRDSEIDWCMSEEEKKQLTLEWYRKIVRRSDIHEVRFLSGI